MNRTILTINKIIKISKTRSFFPKLHPMNFNSHKNIINISKRNFIDIDEYNSTSRNEIKNKAIVETPYMYPKIDFFKNTQNHPFEQLT